MEPHQHKWECATDGKSMLICSIASCNAATRIDDLIARSENKGALEAEFKTYKRTMDNHWLTPVGRKYINRYLRDHFPSKVNKDVPAAIQSTLV